MSLSSRVNKGSEHGLVLCGTLGHWTYMAELPPANYKYPGYGLYRLQSSSMMTIIDARISYV